MREFDHHENLDKVCEEAEAVIRECNENAEQKQGVRTDEYERVEKLREKADVSYEEAKSALEQCGWNLLDAILLLEKQGKVKEKSAQHSTRSEDIPEPEAEPSSFNENASHLRSLLKKLLQIGNTNHLIISHKGKQVLSMPITVLVIMICLAHVVVPLALVGGLFCGLRYSVSGADLGKQAVNDVMDKAAEAAEHVRETVEDSLRKEN